MNEINEVYNKMRQIRIANTNYRESNANAFVVVKAEALVLNLS